MNAPEKPGAQDTVAGSRSGWSSVLRFILSLVMSGAALALVFVFVDIDQMLSALVGAQLHYLPLIALVAMASISVTVPRMVLIFRQLDLPPPPAGFLFRLNFFAAIVAYMVPFAAMADGARAAVLWSQAKLSPKLAIEVSLQDRILALLGFVLLGAIFTPTQVATTPAAADVKQLGLAFFWGVVLAILAGSFLLHVAQRSWSVVWLQRGNELVWRLLRNVSRPRFLLPQAILALCSALIYTTMLWLSLKAVGVSNAPFWLLFTVVPALSISQNVPIFYLGWGAREAAAVVMLTTIVGIGGGQAIAGSLLLGVGVLLGSLPGLLFVGRFAGLRRHTG